MTQYLNKNFTLPSNTKPITQELWLYRVGAISAKEFEELTGHKPDQEE